MINGAMYMGKSCCTKFVLITPNNFQIPLYDCLYSNYVDEKDEKTVFLLFSGEHSRLLTKSSLSMEVSKFNSSSKTDWTHLSCVVFGECTTYITSTYFKGADCSLPLYAQYGQNEKYWNQLKI